MLGGGTGSRALGPCEEAREDRRAFGGGGLDGERLLLLLLSGLVLGDKGINTWGRSGLNNKRLSGSLSSGGLDSGRGLGKSALGSGRLLLFLLLFALVQAKDRETLARGRPALAILGLL